MQAHRHRTAHIHNTYTCHCLQADRGARCGRSACRQWATYEAEQSDPRWHEHTVAIEGSLLLQDLRAPLHAALFCAWFNEYTRFGERDQMAIALHANNTRTSNRTNRECFRRPRALVLCIARCL